MEMALRASDLQRDTRGTYRRLETRLEEYWAKYMDHEMSTRRFYELVVHCMEFGRQLQFQASTSENKFNSKRV